MKDDTARKGPHKSNGTMKRSKGRRRSENEVCDPEDDSEAGREDDGEETKPLRLREALRSLKSQLRALELENERKEKELEIARWRLECVGVEKMMEEVEVGLIL